MVFPVQFASSAAASLYNTQMDYFATDTSAHSSGLLANDYFIVLAQMTYDLVDVRNAFQKRDKKKNSVC